MFRHMHRRSFIAQAALCCFYGYAALFGEEGTARGAEVLLPRDIHFDSTVRIGLDALQALHQEAASKNGTTSGSDTTSFAVVDWGFSLGHTVGRPDLFTLTLCGSKGGGGYGRAAAAAETNQDRAFVVEDKDRRERLGLLRAGGVLDGHGGLGHHVSEFGRNEIILRLNTFLDTHPEDPESIATWLEQTLLPGVDADVPAAVAHSGGATVSMIVQLGSHVYMVNAGDSQSFLVADCHCGGGSEDGNATTFHVLYQTRLDKPDLPDEEERIVRMGGQVTHTTEEDNARVWYTYKDPKTGRPTKNGLAMSRGIGDRPFPGVIPTPLVRTVKVDELVALAVSRCATQAGDERDEVVVSDSGDLHSSKEPATPRCDASTAPPRILAVSATDGLIDYVDGNDIANALFNRDRHVFLGARHLFHTAASGWNKDMGGSYRDDMALSVFEVETSSLSAHGSG